MTKESEHTDMWAKVSVAPAHISFGGHVIRFFKTTWHRFLLTLLAVFSVLWTLVESTSFLLRINVTGPVPYSLMAVASLCSSIAFWAWRYVHRTPSGLHGESRQVQRLVHLKPRFWQLKVALLVLRDRVASIDANLSDIVSGRRVVTPVRKLAASEYPEYGQLRMTTLLQIMDTVKTLLFVTFPKALESASTQLDGERNLLAAVQLIADAYKKTLDYQVEGRAVIPPKGYERAHEIHNTWTKPISDAVHQLCDILETMSKGSSDATTGGSFTIILRAPPDAEEFLAEIDRFGNKSRQP